MITDLPGTPTMQGIDDQHEATGARFLQSIWGSDVSEPVRLHVQAKRYMVTTRPGYLDKLSGDSVRSLALQGGLMTAQECDDFNGHVHSEDAVRLRAWDDAAKQTGIPALGDEAILAELQALMQELRPA